MLGYQGTLHVLFLTHTGEDRGHHTYPFLNSVLVPPDPIDPSWTPKTFPILPPLQGRNPVHGAQNGGSCAGSHVKQGQERAHAGSLPPHPSGVMGVTF